MQVIEDDGTVVIRLHEGEDFFPTLLTALDQVGLGSGVILTGVGMLKDFELGNGLEVPGFIPSLEGGDPIGEHSQEIVLGGVEG